MYRTNLKRALTYNAEIIEWDIKSGNTSMMEAYNLYPYEKILKINNLPKDKRNRTVGYIMQKDKVFAKNLESSFNITVENFLKCNGLDYDFDVLSIKRDAVFVINHDIKESHFIPRIDGSYVINFVPKNYYHGALLLKDYEFYLRNDDRIDIKGINDEEYNLHEKGMLLFIKEVFKRLETRAKIDVHDYMSAFIKAYKHKQLPFEYYREFCPRGGFRVNFGDDIGIFDYLNEEDLIDLDISYNYKNIILPLLENLVIL